MSLILEQLRGTSQCMKSLIFAVLNTWRLLCLSWEKACGEKEVFVFIFMSATAVWNKYKKNEDLDELQCIK